MKTNPYRVTITLSPEATKELSTLAERRGVSMEEAFENMAELHEILDETIATEARDAYTKLFWRTAGEQAKEAGGRYHWHGTAA